MNTILIANIISFVGSLVMVGGGLLKTKSKILLAQNIQFGIQGVGNFMLGGLSGVAINVASIVRNVFCMYRPFTLTWKIIFIILQGALSLGLNQHGLIGCLPFAAACLFTIFLDTDNDKLLKIILTIAQNFWAVYDITIQNYSAFAFDVLTVISNIIGIILLVRAQRERRH